jgi:hypothetical protein
VERLIDSVTNDRGTFEDFLPPIEELLVTLSGTESGEMLRHSTDGWRVRAFIVIDHDHKAEILGGGDVVERFPRHSAGERTIADDRDDSAVALTT